MTTALIFGPADHNRPVTAKELESASWEEGFLTVYLRRGRGWRSPIGFAGGTLYETRLLHDFSLRLDSRT